MLRLASLAFFALTPLVFVEFASLANINLGASMNNSSMSITPIVTNADNEYTFRKSSLSLYGQKSMLKETLFFTGRTEIVDISRDAITVNGTEIAQQKSQGVRSVDLSIIKYLYTDRGWKYHALAGYNIKGKQTDSALQFVLPSDEYGVSTVIMRAKKAKGVVTPIVNGMMGITDAAIKKVELGIFFGKNYHYTEGNALVIQPISKSISFKFFGKMRNYTLENDATAFINERKVMTGLIFKNPQHNSFEFNLYKDFISNEIGSSVGINYFIARKNSDIETKMLHYYEGKYVKKQKSGKSADEKRKEVEQMVDDILEERGF